MIEYAVVGASKMVVIDGSDWSYREIDIIPNAYIYQVLWTGDAYIFFTTDSTLETPWRKPLMYFSYDLEEWFRGGANISANIVLDSLNAENLLMVGEWIVGNGYDGAASQIAFSAHIEAELGA